MRGVTLYMALAGFTANKTEPKMGFEPMIAFTLANLNPEGSVMLGKHRKTNTPMLFLMLHY